PCADPGGNRSKLRRGAGVAGGADRQPRRDDAVRTALVVDKTARPELGYAEKARTLQEALASRTVWRAGDVREQRQTREVVARQESFSCQIAIRVEVAGQRVRAFLQQLDLVNRLPPTSLRGIAFACISDRVIVDD